MRVTIEDGVCNLVIEVNTESMFDNGKGRTIRTIYIFFSSCGYAGEFGGEVWLYSIAIFCQITGFTIMSAIKINNEKFVVLNRIE